jgi:ribonuclease D
MNQEQMIKQESEHGQSPEQSHDEAELPVPPLLGAPRTPLHDLITDERALDAAIAELGAGEGDIALDAERASGYRYSQRAYLIQIYRRGGGLHLIDPAAFPENEIPQIFSPLNLLIQSATSVIHASSQDLPCLREAGIFPTKLFDTELAARIAGFPRVGLGALTESLLNLRLAKEHSAVDWSIRPLHHDWLIYAALDVDVLLDLKDEIVRVLAERKKLEWALEESDAALNMSPALPRKEPWRRTSGIHQVKRAEQLAIVRELWFVRDELARERDIASGRLLNDRAIISCALKTPTSLIHLASLPAFKKDSGIWWSALEKARANPTAPKPPPSDGPPAHIRMWRERSPRAYARLTHAKAQLSLCAQRMELPAENLLAPDIVRRFCWQDPPAGGFALEEVSEFLQSRGARGWQIDLSAPLLHAIQGEVEPFHSESPDEANSDQELE